jgi:NitT/TauT family transport system substrate-binding protein
MRKNGLLNSLYCTLAAAAFAALVAGHAQAQSLQKLTVFAQPSVNNDSLWMAFANNEYTKEGLDITYRLFPSGTTAFQNFNTGQGDIILSGDLPGVQYFFRANGAYRVIAVIERDAKGYVGVARNDIKTPQDLVGKTVATRVGSTGSWFISEYLTKNGVDPSKVTVKNLDTQILPTALCQGDIAAFFIWQPVGSRTLEICPDNSHYLTDATGYIQGYLIAGARTEFLNTPEGKDQVVRFLRATMKGRDVAEKDFPAVAAYAKAKLDLSEKATREQWVTNTRPLALDEVFFQDFCSLSKWAMKDKVTSEPLDFSKFTWRDGLLAIDPKLAPAGPPPCEGVASLVCVGSLNHLWAAAGDRRSAGHVSRHDRAGGGAQRRRTPLGAAGFYV